MVEGVVIYAPGSTLPQTVLVHRLTAYGLDVIEGNFQDLKTVGNVTIAGDVIGGQVAIGNSNTQVQSVSIDSFNKLYDFLDTRLDVSQRAILKPLIRAFEEAVKAGSLNPETLRKIGEAIKTWGPAITGPIIDGIMRLLGLKGG